MPRMTDEERAQLDALSKKAKEEEEAETSFKVRARNAKGIEVEYTGTAAKEFLRKHGFEEDEEEAGDEEEEQDEEPENKGGYFRGRKGK